MALTSRRFGKSPVGQRRQPGWWRSCRRRCSQHRARSRVGPERLSARNGLLRRGQSKLPDGSERSLFRIWSPLISTFPRPRGARTLTDERKRAQARCESGVQAVADC
jgi:hypothetical protein